MLKTIKTDVENIEVQCILIKPGDDLIEYQIPLNRMQLKMLHNLLVNTYNLELVGYNDLREMFKKKLEEDKYGFYKEFKLKSRKVLKPATYKQLQWLQSLAEKTNSDVKNPTSSHFSKHFDLDDLHEAIALMKDGRRIKID